MARSRSGVIGLAIALVAGCGRRGFDAADAPLADAAVDPFAYIELGEGWMVGVFRDLSADFVYDAADFVDGAETYDNMPRVLFTMRAPYSETLVVTAGRLLLEMSAVRVDVHDLGQHPPNTLNLPDNFTGGVWVDDLDGTGPNVLLSSASTNGGDGLFTLSTGWLTQTDTVYNNTRGVAWDAPGAFDGVNAPTVYFGTMNGLFRRETPLQPAIATLDTRTMKILPDGDLLLTRLVASGVERLVRVQSTTHAETMILEGTTVRIGDGTPLGAVAWIVVDGHDLYRFGAANELERVAHGTDPDTEWQWAATPPSEHVLGANAPRVYLLETNRVRDVDRVLVLDRR